jgi:hypothetical protein
MNLKKYTPHDFERMRHLEESIWRRSRIEAPLNLKVAKDRKSLAQKKPLLVLAILDLVEAGLVG